MSKTNAKKKKVPAVAGFDKRPMDYFRGSRGFSNKIGFTSRRDFTGFKRGSR